MSATVSAIGGREDLQNGSAARGTNEAGLIVGFLNSGGGVVDNESRGFILVVPPGGDAAGAFAGCFGINNFRHVVCEVTP